MNSTVLILDFGSQYTQLIARRVRELGVYCEICPFHLSLTLIAQKEPKALILSGSPASINDKNAPMPDKKIFSLDIPILGICYGMHIIANHFKGSVNSSGQRQFGRAFLHIEGQSVLLSSCDRSEVWMSHGDKVLSIPNDFHISSTSESGIYCSIENNEKKIYGLQFHPEVFHSTKGKEVFSNFLFKICLLQKNWSPNIFIDSISEKITTSIKSEKAICAISGGVDSAVAAALVSKSIHSNLRCVFVDNGLLRKNEAEQVSDALQTLNLNLTVIKASSTFLTRLKGVADPERKRKIIGKTFIELFESKIKSEKFLIQGTLYPDVIESVNVLGPSQIIKSHHNVGGLPKRMKLKLFEPLRELFKDEVREVGKRLGLPSEILERHPFPGPGLAVRIIGEITKSKLNLLREVDEIFISELRSASLYHHIWQAFAVLLSTKSVGVMGDNRSYENVIALRAVNSIDGMTADWSKLPHDFLATVSTKIVNCVHGVNRVTYDISSKPPATIEWE